MRARASRPADSSFVTVHNRQRNTVGNDIILRAFTIIMIATTRGLSDKQTRAYNGKALRIKYVSLSFDSFLNRLPNIDARRFLECNRSVDLYRAISQIYFYGTSVVTQNLFKKIVYRDLLI